MHYHNGTYYNSNNYYRAISIITKSIQKLEAYVERHNSWIQATGEFDKIEFRCDNVNKGRYRLIYYKIPDRHARKEKISELILKEEELDIYIKYKGERFYVRSFGKIKPLYRYIDNWILKTIQNDK